MNAYLSLQERLRVARIVARAPGGQLIVRHAQMGRVEVDAERCSGCRMCVRVCPARALVMDGPANVRMTGDHAACVACGDCIAICKPAAIRITRGMTYEGLYKHVGRGSLEQPRRF